MSGIVYISKRVCIRVTWVWYMYCYILARVCVLYEEDRIEKPAGSLCCQEIMAMRIVNKVIGLRRAEDRLKIGMT